MQGTPVRVWFVLGLQSMEVAQVPVFTPFPVISLGVLGALSILT